MAAAAAASSFHLSSNFSSSLPLPPFQDNLSVSNHRRREVEGGGGGGGDGSSFRWVERERPPHLTPLLTRESHTLHCDRRHYPVVPPHPPHPPLPIQDEGRERGEAESRSLTCKINVPPTSSSSSLPLGQPQAQLQGEEE